MVALYIGDSPDGNSILPDPNGYKDEILEMIDAKIAEAMVNNTSSGVHVGSEEPTNENVKIWINPDDVPSEIPSGNNIIIDNTFSPTSENAQSGKAIAPVFANALKGSASGEKAVAVSGVSPIEHELAIKVKKTERLSTSVAQSQAFTRGSEIEFLEPITVEAYTELQISCDFRTDNETPIYIMVLNANNMSLGSREIAPNKTINTTLTVYDTSGANNYEISKLVIASETSGTVLHFIVSADAIVSPKGVTISRYGKNLFGLTKAYVEENPLVNNRTYKVDLKLLPNTTYTLSSDVPMANPTTANIWFGGGSTTTDGVWKGQTRSRISSSDGVIQMHFLKENLDTIFNDYYIQLELGGSATAYEPYTKPDTATAGAEGKVEGLTSVSPNMTLVSDTNGVVIDLAYNRDINKAFAELQQAILNNI